MTRDAIVAMLERYTEAVGRSDPKAAASVFAPDGILEGPSVGISHGRIAIEKTFAHWMRAFPDWTFDWEKPVIDGLRAARSYRMHGTQEGPFFGLEGGHKHISGGGVALFRLQPEGLARVRYIYDFSGMLLKTGVLKASPIG